MRGPFCYEKKWALQRDFFQHFNTNFTRCDFTQGGYAGFVLAFNFWRVALVEHAGAVGGSKNQLEAVRDLLEAVFDGDAGHKILRKTRGY